MARGRLTRAIAELVFPDICLGCEALLSARSEGRSLCRACAPLCVPIPEALKTVRGISACWAHDGPLADAMLRFKYGGQASLAGPLGRLLAREPAFWRSPATGATWDLIVPVPLHPGRRFARGFNQSLLMARHAARAGPGATVSPRVLRKTRATPPQAGLSPVERRANLDGAFAIRNPTGVRLRNVLVLDDVTTTGATLESCMHVLRAAGATSVGGLALLRALA